MGPRNVTEITNITVPQGGPNITADNVTGVTSYSLAPSLTALAEWQEMVEAMNRCALASEGTDLTQADWLHAVANTAAGVAFMDRCVQCARLDRDHRSAPVTVTVDEGRVHALYSCPAGHSWQCHFSLDRRI